MKTVYLVDYENVNESGLAGSGGCFDSTDHVVIFYTKFAEKIRLDVLQELSGVKFTAIRVKAGHQSLDMHLSSYLGYLIGTQEDEEVSYVIVSNDFDYDGIIEYWSDRKEVSIQRQSSINGDNFPEDFPESLRLPEWDDEWNIDADWEEDDLSATNVSTPDERSALNGRVMQALGGHGFCQADIGFCASTAVRCLGMDSYKQKIYRKYISQFGMETGLQYYKIVKPCL